MLHQRLERYFGKGYFMTQPAPLLTVKVRTIRLEAESVISLELVSTDDKGLAPFSPGSHIDLHLPNGVTRCYSLMNSARDHSHYSVGVFKDQKSSGGSRYIHDQLRVGQILTIGSPRNNFPVDLTAAHSIVFAGGIGATPFRSMLDSLNQAKQPWTMYYCARSRDRAAFILDFEQLTAAGFGQLIMHLDEEVDGRLLDLAQIVSAAPLGTHFYCCGPAPMMKAYKIACTDRPNNHVHWESFKAEQEPDKHGGFFVTLAQTGRRIAVPPGKTILEMLIEHKAFPVSILMS